MTGESTEPPQWVVDYWVSLCKREHLRTVVRDMRRFVEQEMLAERAREIAAG